MHATPYVDRIADGRYMAEFSLHPDPGEHPYGPPVQLERALADRTAAIFKGMDAIVSYTTERYNIDGESVTMVMG